MFESQITRVYVKHTAVSTPAIRVENISKLYRLGKKEDRPATLLQALGRMALAPIRNFGRLRSLTHFDDLATASDILWALRDVSFEIQPGEVVGLIGRNGAGKSTMLKILSRIMPPTKGKAEIRGRLASLLEVGTGFHPELTGRDNVYLNGAMLGMRQKEISDKFDEIVAFSEIEKFIDTPVKRYSSGMYVRLAFAVAAHLEPEILIVDEVLAVGDAAFQQKCLGKMKSVSKSSGRTILFVSHNITAIKALCTRAVYFHQGRVALDGKTEEVAAAYLNTLGVAESMYVWRERASAPGGNGVWVEGIKVSAPKGMPVITIDTGAVFEITFQCEREGINLSYAIYLANREVMLFESICIVTSANDSKVGRYNSKCAFPPNLLNAGEYHINIVFLKDQVHHLFVKNEIVAFKVENTNTGRGFNLDIAPGPIRPLLDWTSQPIS